MQDRPDPLISIIVPVYNVQDHVGACLISLQKQVFRDFEVIVIDDGSTDQSGARARMAVPDDPRFRFVHQENRGLSCARNRGLDLARGDFVAFVDSDDTVSPDYLARLHQALEAGQADWAACGIRFRDSRGTVATHSAIHDAPALFSHAAIHRYPLQDWNDIIRHFPSAWNKLYRRRLIADLRFDEGTWFEDHTFFYRVAKRTDHLLHVPEPLYIQTRNRAGQITGADDARVFEQFDVLETMWQVMQAPPVPGRETPKTGAGRAFSNISSRLLYERSFALHAPDRRAEFARAARDWLAAHNLDYTPDWDISVQHSWALEMAGEVPVSIVLPWNGQSAAFLTKTLDSLSGGNASPGREILIVCDNAHAMEDARRLATGCPVAQVLHNSGSGVGAARNHGLAAARGRYVCFIDAGDVMIGDSLQHWVETMLRHDADFGVARYRFGAPDTFAVAVGEHSGFHDLPKAPPRLSRTGLMGMGPDAAHLETVQPTPATPAQMALALDACPSAKIFRRDFLTTMGLRFGQHVRSEWPLVLGAALLAPRAVYIAEPGIVICQHPEAQSLLRAPLSARALLCAYRAIPKTLPAPAVRSLPANWRSRLFSRAVWESLHHATDRHSLTARLRFTLPLALYRLVTTIGHRSGEAAHDPFIGPKIQLLSMPWRIVNFAAVRHNTNG